MIAAEISLLIKAEKLSEEVQNGLPDSLEEAKLLRVKIAQVTASPAGASAPTASMQQPAQKV